MLELRECGECGPTGFEVVECVDGHGADCPERVCTGCGAVLVVGLTPLTAVS